MTINNNIYFQKYKVLLSEIEQHTAFLEDMHNKHMKCKNGCDLCCIDFSIFPIEFHFILNEIKNEDQKPDLEEKSENEICAFLKNHSCTIYNHRPIMCRTHGLPLLYANDDGEFELSACELNFTAFDFEDFSMENTLPQDKYNSKLFLLNREFIADFADNKYGELDLIPLKELAKRLKTETF
jgi:Fe-S-cluster containining protein